MEGNENLWELNLSLLIAQDIKMVLEKHNNGESDTAVDVEYYENTLKKLVVAKARAVGECSAIV